LKRQYLGDSKDSFKWDYHDYLVSELNYPVLVIALMMTPDDTSDEGKSKLNLFQARKGIINFCIELRKTRSLESIRSLPLKTGNSYAVALHRGDEYFTKQNRNQYFSNFKSQFAQVILLDPDNGFEPEKSLNNKHVCYSEITKILRQTSDNSVISVFHHFRRIKFVEDYARIFERLEEGYSTAIYWNFLMFVAVSKFQDTISRVMSANRKYAETNPSKIVTL